MLNSVRILLFIAFSLPAFSQTGKIGGVVKDAATQVVLHGATIVLVGTGYGASTTETGSFLLENIPPGTYALRASLLSYHVSVTALSLRAGESLHLVIFLEPSHIGTEEVVITGTRTVRTIDDVPVRVEAIPQEEVEEKLLMTPSNVAMLLNESTGMRVQTTSAASNTANLRIQGLSGRYTQLLTDGIPNFGGLSSGFGLTQLPPLNLRQVEVIKGAASALYGADAISGVVNFLTKEPREQREASALANGTTQKGFDAAAFYSQKFDDIGFTMFASKNNQSLVDVDGDRFGDIAEYDRVSVVPKLYYKFSNHINTRITVGVLSERRVGGTLATSEPAGIRFREENTSKRLDFASQLDWNISSAQSLTIKLAAMRLRRDALYGNAPFNATQSLLYIDAQYTFDFTSHNLLLGTVLNLEEFRDRTPHISFSRSYRYTAPALLLQDEWKLSNVWTLLMSTRLDFHNTYGTFWMPRVSLMHRPTPMLTVRAGGGTGFKAPTMFVEEAEEIGFRNVRPVQNVEAEKAISGSFDVNWRWISGEVGAAFNFAFYITHLSNALAVDDDSLSNDVLVLRNATGSTLTRGGEFSAKFTYSDFKLSLGYTYLYASQSNRGRTYELERNPRHSLGAVLVWENEELNTKVGVENYWTGAQRLERNPYRDRSPDYWITGIIAEKGFGPLRLFVNFENIFDTRQTRFEPIIVGAPQLGTLRTLPIYAPLEGRVINGGIRFVL